MMLKNKVVILLLIVVCFLQPYNSQADKNGELTQEIAKKVFVRYLKEDPKVFGKFFANASKDDLEKLARNLNFSEKRGHSGAFTINLKERTYSYWQLSCSGKLCVKQICKGAFVLFERGVLSGWRLTPPVWEYNEMMVTD